MAIGAVKSEKTLDQFTRLHRVFVEHFAYAIGFVWLATVGAALHAPWVDNIRGLIDPSSRSESTLSYLFALPVLMTAGWIAFVTGVETMRRSQVFKNQLVEFGLAGLVVFTVFCMAIDRAAVAYLLG